MTGRPTLLIVFFPCLQTWRREAGALREAAAIAASASPISDPLQRILEAALPVLPSDHLVLVHVSTDRTASVIVAAVGTAGVWRWVRGPLGSGIASRAVETGEAQLASEAFGTEETSTGPLRSGVAVPVILHGRVFGVLASADDRRRFTRRHIDLLRAFADHCATAMDNARN